MNRIRWGILAAIISLFIWYVLVALGLTGHTKVIWGAQKIASKIHHATGSN